MKSGLEREPPVVRSYLFFEAQSFNMENAGLGKSSERSSWIGLVVVVRAGE